MNPLGSVRGKYSKKYRLIVDFSAPHNDDTHASLNSLIDKKDFSLSYVSLDEAVSKILEFGKYSTLCKTDVIAFKRIGIKYELWKFHGIKW